VAKTILESIAKTILTDKSIKYKSDSKIQFLVKRSFETLPIFSKLGDKDSESAKSIIGSFENKGFPLENRHQYLPCRFRFEI
jgi:hypothetical protein